MSLGHSLGWSATSQHAPPDKPYTEWTRYSAAKCPMYANTKSWIRGTTCWCGRASRLDEKLSSYQLVWQTVMAWPMSSMASQRSSRARIQLPLESKERNPFRGSQGPNVNWNRMPGEWSGVLRFFHLCQGPRQRNARLLGLLLGSSLSLSPIKDACSNTATRMCYQDSYIKKWLVYKEMGYLYT